MSPWTSNWSEDWKDMKSLDFMKLNHPGLILLAQSSGTRYSALLEMMSDIA